MNAGLRAGGLYLILFPGFAAALGTGCDGAPEREDLGAGAEHLQVCPGPGTVDGLDVSYWQGPSVDWAAVAASGKKFAFIRLNHGVNNIDSYFERNWKGAKDNGIVRGAYQFFVPSDDVAAQAKILVDRLDPLIPGDLPPVLDVEEADDAGAAALAAKVGQWMEIVESALGVKPIIYTGKYFWDTEIKSPAFSANPLWIANWGVSCPNIPSPWTAWAFWQHSSTGSVPGISGDVDLDTFNGTLEDMSQFAVQEPNPVCGDGTCNGEETGAACAQDCARLEFALPTDGATVSNPVTFRVDADPAVARVNYFAETWPIGSSNDPASQFEAVWTFGTPGLRKISAEGFDKFGARIAAAVITISVVSELPDSGVDDASNDAGAGDGGGTDDGWSPGDSEPVDGGADSGAAPDSSTEAGSDAAGDANPGSDSGPVNDAGPKNPCGPGTVLENGRCDLLDAGGGSDDERDELPADSSAGCSCSVAGVTVW